MGSDNSSSPDTNPSRSRSPSNNKVAALLTCFLLFLMFANSTNRTATQTSSLSDSDLQAEMNALAAEKSTLLRNINIMDTEKKTLRNNLRAPLASTSTTSPPPPATALPPTPPVTPPTPPSPSIAINTSGGPMQLYSSEFDSSSNPSVVDFPCPLRDDPDPTACKLECEDATCSRGVKVCETYVECTHVVYGGSKGEDLTGKFVTLKHEVVKEDLSALDNAFAKWSSEMTKETKPRTYVIISYGGSGSKMLSGWISDLPKSSVVTVKHMHDPNPPNVMRTFNRPLREATHNGDYRDRHIPGGLFSKDTALIPKDKYDDFRYVYIFKDPVEGLVSRYGHGHCVHVGGDCSSEQNFPTLDQYASGGKDSFHISNFFDKWTTSDPSREYPVLAINYHKIWDNVPSIVEALGLPASYAQSFPKRTETVRNNKTGSKEGHNNHSEDVREKLRGIYKSVRDNIFTMPAMTVI
ncbi:hypothetical protein TrST_g14122 [Triparma strigata]|uniref:Uncharacterized protein n=1 Tax=Triparma strigata TaxID=1606541 RepID=A0A9W7E6B3_9STRA|nr:hypothetical protein TrST_g14122 [Triparma strigata]